MQNEVLLLFDSIRDPRDIAEIIHLGLAADIQIEFTGSSLNPNHPKVIAIINSWLPEFINKPNLKHVTIHHDFQKRILQLKKDGYEIIGTSSTTGEKLFDSDLTKGKHAIVFGTETSGLTKEKMSLMDKILSIPMKNNTRFFTLRAIAPVFAYETLRQKKMF